GLPGRHFFKWQRHLLAGAQSPPARRRLVVASSVSAKDRLALAFVCATKPQTVRVRARPRRKRQSRAQSSGFIAAVLQPNRECSRAQRQSVFRQHRRTRDWTNAGAELEVTFIAISE